jgi:monoamine oxidase
MLLLFVDARYADYWKRLDEMSATDQRYYSSEFEKSMNEASRREFHRVLDIYGTGEAVAARVQDLLAKVTGKSAPVPIAVILKHWSDRPYHVGWHAWNVGTRSWEIAGKLVRPFLDANLYTCGEAFSGEQGWIEGALKSAERVLESIGVPSPPSWVDKVGYEEQKELWM